ncbi:MAG: response regulator [Verrucomicrobiia bacterium]
MAKILVVDDDCSVREVIRDVLKDADHEVDTATDEIEAAEYIKKVTYELVVADMVMRNPKGGLEVLRAANKKSPLTQVIILTAYGSVENAVKAMEAGAFTYLEKRGIGRVETVLLRQMAERAIKYRGMLAVAPDNLTVTMDQALNLLADISSQVQRASEVLKSLAAENQVAAIEQMSTILTDVGKEVDRASRLIEVMAPGCERGVRFLAKGSRNV